MKQEIQGRKDIEHLVNEFYEKVKKDDLLSGYFAHVNWEKHLPLMYSFWENTLMFTGGYFGNPLKSHQNFHKFKPLNEELFARWLELFVESVDELFEGEKADLAKQRAMSISTVMLMKIVQHVGQQQ